jgi:hypothetical protein
MKKIILYTQLLLLLLLFAVDSKAQMLPKLYKVPDSFTTQQKEKLTSEREKLVEQKKIFFAHVKAFNLKCEKVEKNTPAEEKCIEELTVIEEEQTKLSATIISFDKEIGDIVVKLMKALAKEMKWSTDEQIRLDSAFSKLNSDVEINTDSDTVKQTWDNILKRGKSEAFMKEAANGDGPGLPGAGKQDSLEDCAIFALANATGLPYPEVAARATKLISEGKWNSAAERSHPQKLIEEEGLNGGEIVMLTEAFGQVEVIPSGDFARTLKEGHTIMINTIPYNGVVNGGHEVVLTKTFQHNGETWYELIDSNQTGSMQRLYLSNKELLIILQEKGIVYRPDKGTTPMIIH